MKMGIVALRLLVLTTMMARAVAAEDVVVKAMTFNVRTSYAGVDKAHRCSNWHGARKENVLQEFHLSGADFVGTQETTDEQRAFLDASLASTYGSIGKSGGSLGGNAPEVNAVYYKKAEWKVLSEGTFWLGPNPDAPSAAWGMQYYRTCVHGRFEHIATGKTVCVLNTHFETPGNDEAQTNGARVIIERMGGVCDSSDKVAVLMGDLNGELGYPAVKKLLASGLTEPLTQGTFCGDMLASGCGAKFDYTMYRVAGGACLTDAQVFRRNFDSCYSSDHALQMSSFCISGNCCSDKQGEESTPSPVPSPSPSPTPSNSPSSAPTPSPSSTVSILSLNSSEASSDSSQFSDRSVSDASSSLDNSLSGSDEGAGTVVAPSMDEQRSRDSEKKAKGEEKEKDKDSEDAVEISTKSDGGSDASGAVLAILAIVVVAGVVCAAVIRKKKLLDKHIGQEKSNFAFPNPFRRDTKDDDDHTDDQISVLEDRSFAVDRLSSPAILDARGTGRSSLSCTNSAVYRNQDFALL